MKLLDKFGLRVEDMVGNEDEIHEKGENERPRRMSLI